MEQAIVILTPSGVQHERQINIEEQLQETAWIEIEQREHIPIVKQNMTETQKYLIELVRSTGDTEELFTSTVLWKIKFRKTEGEVEDMICKNFYERLKKLRLEYCYVSPDAYAALEDSRIFYPEQHKVIERSILLLRGQTDEEYAEILAIIDDHDIMVLARHVLVSFSNEEEKHFFPWSKESRSGEARVLLLEKIGLFSDLEFVIGPASKHTASKFYSQTLRARFDSVDMYVPSNPTQAAMDIKKFFPELLQLERTVLIIKPRTIPHIFDISQLLKRHGFYVLQEQLMEFTPEAVEMAFSDRTERELRTFTESLVGGQSKIILLTRASAVEALKKLCGPSDPDVAREMKPHSLIALYGVSGNDNGFYYSDSIESAFLDVAEFFPHIISQHIPTDSETQMLLVRKPAARPNGVSAKSVQDVLVDGLTALCKEKPTGNDALLWLADWIDANNPFMPRIEVPSDEEENQSATGSAQTPLFAEIIG